jgi:hypothetical protein
MKNLTAALFASILLLTGGAALADPVSQVWTCKLNDGKTAEDAQSLNSKWLAWAREAGGSDEITSSLVTAIVGDTGFLWVDTFPDLVTWAKVVEAGNADDNGLDAEFDALQTCSGNRLYSGEETK